MRPDLNLLIVFDAVAEARSVTLAADRLSLSQSAVSHALNRLREIVGDPLFTRSRKGLQLSARALEMVAPVKDMLTSANMLMSNREFNPTTAERRFRVAASDYAALAVVPYLIRNVRKQAPNIVLDIVPAGANTLAQLEDGSVDFSFWGTSPPPLPYYSQRLFNERYVGVMSAQHQLAIGKIKPKITLKQYLSCSHLTVSIGVQGINVVDQILMKLGHKRKIAAISHSFIGNIQCLKTTDLIATLPSRICTSELIQGLVMFEIPLDLPEMEYSVCWHRRADADAGARWLRSLLN